MSTCSFHIVRTILVAYLYRKDKVLYSLRKHNPFLILITKQNLDPDNTKIKNDLCKFKR